VSDKLPTSNDLISKASLEISELSRQLGPDEQKLQDYLASIMEEAADSIFACQHSLLEGTDDRPTIPRCRGCEKRILPLKEYENPRVILLLLDDVISVVKREPVLVLALAGKATWQIMQAFLDRVAAAGMQDRISVQLQRNGAGFLCTQIAKPVATPAECDHLVVRRDGAGPFICRACGHEVEIPDDP
jgi:hypothetical protein